VAVFEEIFNGVQNSVAEYFLQWAAKSGYVTADGALFLILSGVRSALCFSKSSSSRPSHQSSDYNGAVSAAGLRPGRTAEAAVATRLVVTSDKWPPPPRTIPTELQANFILTMRPNLAGDEASRSVLQGRRDARSE
jgi:hypothetical protein